MNTLGKLGLLLFAGLYVVSPIDLCPGPIDDLLILMISLNYS